MLDCSEMLKEGGKVGGRAARREKIRGPGTENSEETLSSRSVARLSH